MSVDLYPADLYPVYEQPDRSVEVARLLETGTCRERLARGGPDEPGNLHAVHAHCNLAKGDR